MRHNNPLRGKRIVRLSTLGALSLAQEVDSLFMRAGGSSWVWESKAKRYRNTKNGQFIGHGRMYDMRNTMIDRQSDRADELTTQLWDGRVTLAGWRRGMRDMLKETYTIQYVLAKGGRGMMTPRDWGILGQMLRGQYEALNDFTKQLAGGKYAIGEIGRAKWRSRLYVDSSAQAFERAKTETHGLPRLPYYPGDGSTVCVTKCKCQWVIRQRQNTIEAVWTLGAADHCTDCIIRAARHSAKNPLVFLRVDGRGWAMSLPSIKALGGAGVSLPIHQVRLAQQRVNGGVAHVG